MLRDSVVTAKSEMLIRNVEKIKYEKDKANCDKKLFDNHNHLKGSKHNNDYVEAFSSYSDHFVPGFHSLQKAQVKRALFEKEVLSLTRPGRYMGIWQLCGLASVLKMRVAFVFFLKCHAQ